MTIEHRKKKLALSRLISEYEQKDRKKISSLLREEAIEEISARKTDHKNEKNSFKNISYSSLINKIKNNYLWSQIKDEFWAFYKKQNSLDCAARLIEAVVFIGDEKELIESLNRLSNLKFSFYEKIDEKLRKKILNRIQKNKKIFFSIIDYLLLSKYEKWLSTHEIRLIFSELVRVKSKEAVVFFLRFENRIIQGFYYDRKNEKIFIGRAYLELAKFALKFELKQEAILLACKIMEGDPFYEEAVSFLLDHNLTQSFITNSCLEKKISELNSWQQKIKYLSDLLGSFQLKTKKICHEFLVCNSFLENIDKYFIEEEALKALTYTLLNFKDLEERLPNLFFIFRKNFFIIHEPQVEKKLWEDLSKTKATQQLDLLQGVALFHMYLLSDGTKEDLLWKARKKIIRADNKSLSWKKVCDWFFNLDSSIIREKKYSFEKLKKQVIITKKIEELEISYVREYLANCGENIQLEAINHLFYYAKSQKAPLLEKQLLCIKAEKQFYTNSDLRRLWELSNILEDNDLSWRVSTVLASREALKTDIKDIWNLSGERRYAYDIILPSFSHIEKILYDFTSSHKKLAWSFLKSGLFIADINFICDQTLEVKKISSSKNHSVIQKMDALIAKIQWIEQQRKNYYYKKQGNNLDIFDTPSFLSGPISSDWSFLFLRMSQYLGFNTFNWDLKLLHSNFTRLSIDGSNIGSNVIHKELSRIYLKMTADQRHSIKNLASVLKNESYEQINYSLFKFLARMTTVMMQNHYDSLKSLQAFRLPILYIKDHEKWILSDQYSLLRQELSTKTSFMVPKTLTL